MKNKTKFLLAALSLFAVNADAHTMTWGYESNGGGSYTVWAGAWHTLPNNEGSLLYTPTDFAGVAQGPDMSAVFNLLSSTKPAGLIDGTTNFYADSSGIMQATDIDNNGPVYGWQGVTITGITNPGYYHLRYDPASSFSFLLDPADDSIRNGVIIMIGGSGGLGAPTNPNAGPQTIQVNVNQTSPLVLGAVATFESGTIAPTSSLVLPDVVVNATHTGALDSTNGSMTGSGTVVINGTKLSLSGSSSLTFDGTLTTLTGNGVNLTGDISGAGILENSGGNNTISGANTSAGSNIVGGSLTLGNTNSLGVNGNSVSTGTLILPNAGAAAVKTYAQNFTVSGVGENSVGAIELGTRGTVGSSRLTGTLTVTANSKLRTEGNGGTQTFAGAINVTNPTATLEVLTALGSVGVIDNSLVTSPDVLEKTGAGMLRIASGSTVDADNGVNLRAGVLKVNGAIIGDLTAFNGSNLGGSGTISGDVTINSGATLAPGNSPGILTQSTGDATLNGGSTFQAELGGTTAGNGNGFHDQFYVQNGSLTLDSAAGGVLLEVRSWVKADGVTTFTAQRRDVFSILRSSNGISGTFADIVNPDYNTWMLYDNQGVSHTLGNLYGTGLLGNQTFAAYATAPWQTGILTSIWNQSVTASASSTTANPAGFIDSATLAGRAAVIVLTSDDLERDLALMSPAAYVAVPDFGLTVGRDLVGQALDNVSLWTEGKWIIGAGYVRSQHDYLGGGSAVSQYRLQANSSVASLRYQLASTWQVGTFFGYTDGQTNAIGGNSKIRGNTFGLLADGTTMVAGRAVALRAAASVGDFNYDMKRNGSVTSDQKMASVAAELSASTDLYKSETLGFGPTIGVNYGRARTSAFTEAGGTLPLSIAGGTTESAVTTAGLQLTYKVSSLAVVTVKAGWEHEFAGAANIGANFSGGSGDGFSSTASQSRNTAVGGLDLGVRLPSAFTLHLTGEVRDNRQFNRNVVLGAAVNRRF